VRAALKEDGSKEASSWREARNTALIAAIFGLLGTVVGGGITYFTNRALQDQQISEQRALQAAETRVAARLLYERYAKIDQAVIAMFCQGFYVSGGQFPPASLSDEELVVGQASAAGLQTLNNADIQIGLLLETLKGKSTGQPVANGDSALFPFVDQTLRNALAVVTPMAGFAKHTAPVLHEGGVDQAACH